MGNGVTFAQFANDPTFQSAATNGGNPFDALARVAEVAPFLPSFQAPKGWAPPSDTSIPTDFIPASNEKLVIPPTVEVPRGVELPDTFVPTAPPVVEPAEPGEPDDEDTGDDAPVDDVPDDDTPGGDSPGWNPNGLTFELTAGADTPRATARDDTFLARDAASLQTGDVLNGKGGSNKLIIEHGAIENGAAPTTYNVQHITNSHFGRYEDDKKDIAGLTLNLENAHGLTELWSDFSLASSEDGVAGNSRVIYYDNASAATTFGISNMRPDDVIGKGHVSILGLKSDDTLKLSLSGNQANSYYSATAEAVSNVTINVEPNNEGRIALDTAVENITVTGAGNLDFYAFAARSSELKVFNAAGSSGKIGVDLTGAKNLEEARFGSNNDSVSIDMAVISSDRLDISLGGENDELQLTGSVHKGGLKTIHIDGGDGYDELTIGPGTNLSTIRLITENVEKVTNLDFGRYKPHTPTVALDLSEMTGVQELWSDFSRTAKGDGIEKNSRVIYYENASGVEKFGISKMPGAGDIGKGHISIQGLDVDAALEILLSGNSKDSYYAATAKGIEDVIITMEDGNDGAIVLDGATKVITVGGTGNLAFQDNRLYTNLETIDAGAVKGNIKFGNVDAGGGKGLVLGKNFSITTGSGSDTIDLSGLKSMPETVVINAGGGGDTITLSSATTVTHTLVYGNQSDSTVESFDTITGFQGVLEGDIIDLSALLQGTEGAVSGVAVVDSIADPGAGEIPALFEPDHAVAFYQDSDSTYVYIDVNGDGSFASGDDSILKLAGQVDLTADNFVFTGTPAEPLA